MKATYKTTNDKGQTEFNPITVQSPYFNVTRNERVNHEFNCYNVLLSGNKLRDVITYKPAKGFSNPTWFVQQIVNS